MTGIGGQGTLTATRLLAQAAINADIEVTAGEVHGMAQRGGVVESVVLLGGWRSLRLDFGEADILVGFEALETLRALPYLRKWGCVFSSDEQIPPLSVCQGEAVYPPLKSIKTEIGQKASAAYFVPCHGIGKAVGNPRAGAMALLGALCASGLLPFGLQALEAAIRAHLPEKIQSANLKAIQMGADWLANANTKLERD